MNNPYIIAEIGSNWLTKEDCYKSISMASFVGANAVKFQFYTHEELYGLPGTMPGELPEEWLPHLKDEADTFDIDFMCSAFSVAGINKVDPFVKIHKVASAECNHIGMLERLREIGKPVFISSGGHDVWQMRDAIDALEGVQTTALYCVSSYPAEDVGVAAMLHLKQILGVPVGFSDHTTSRTIPVDFVSCGATVIEKHFTINRYMNTPDADHSLDPDQFKEMVNNIRIMSVRIPTRSEDEMIKMHNRRLIAIQDIPIGSSLKEGINYGAFRSKRVELEAMSPMELHNVNGMITNKFIKAGYGIRLVDIERAE